MLYIIFFILKTAGIILACILGLLLTGLLLLLFVPIRYRIVAGGRLGAETPLWANLRITWLLHLVNAAFSYPDAAYLRVRICIFPLFDPSAKKKKSEKVRKKKKKPPKNSSEEGPWEEMVCGTQPPDTTGGDASEREKTAAGEEEKRPEKQDRQKKQDRSEQAARTQRKKGFTDTVRQAWAGLKHILTGIWKAMINIQYTIKVICDKIKKIIADIQYYSEVLQSDVFRAALGRSGKQLGRIWSSVRPKKCDIRMTVGTGDPAGTGQILAVYGILYPFIGNNVRIEADFSDQPVADGSMYIRGKIRIFTLFMAGVTVYRDKNIRRLIKMFKKEEV